MALVPFTRAQGGVDPEKLPVSERPKSRYLSVDDLPPVLRQVLSARKLNIQHNEVDVNVGRWWLFSGSTVWGSVTEYVFVNLTTGETTNKVFDPYVRLEDRFDAPAIPGMDYVLYFPLQPDVAVIRIIDLSNATSSNFRVNRQDVELFVHEVNFAKLLPPLQIPTLREFDILELLVSNYPKYYVDQMKRKKVSLRELKDMAKKGFIKVSNRSFPELTIDGRNMHKNRFDFMKGIFDPIRARICAKYPEDCRTKDYGNGPFLDPQYLTKADEEYHAEVDKLYLPKYPKGLNAGSYYARAVKMKHRKRPEF